MPYNPDLHHRRSARLPNYNYAQPGAYLPSVSRYARVVTLCTYDRECMFGDVVEGKMRLNALGSTVAGRWHVLPRRFSHIALDSFVSMPNHLHGIFIIKPRGRTRTGDISDSHEARTDESPHTPENCRGEASDRPAPPDAHDVPPMMTTAIHMTLDEASPVPSPPQTPLQTHPQMPVGTRPRSLAAAIQHFKSATTRQINRHRQTPGATVWQRNYYDRIIRTEKEGQTIRRYIEQNPAKWPEDRNNPDWK